MGYIVDFGTMISDNIYMVTNLRGEKMDLASLPVSRIVDLVNNNVDTLFFTGEAGKDRKSFIVIDGQTAEITPWVIDRVLMSTQDDPMGFRDDLSLCG